MIPEEFPQDDDLIYWNHAAVGVWPRRTRDAVCAFADENMRRGAAGYTEWMRIERRLRARAARLLGVPGPDDIALVKNTSEGLSLVAHGMEWRPGDRVVITNLEFPSNRIVWESLRPFGVDVHAVDIRGTDPEGAIIEALDARTRIVSVSSVQYGNGLRLKLARIGQACRQRGIWFCIDAIQHLGALRFDASEVFADFVVADGHKWLLGPEGLALMYVRKEVRESLQLRQYGWHMVEHAGDFERTQWRPAASCRRFEPGSPNMLGIHALEASLSLFEEVGIDRIEAQVLQHTQTLIDWVAAHAEWKLLSPCDPERQSGIVTFAVSGLDHRRHVQLVAHCMSRGLVCACRGGGIRISPHFYNAMDDLEMADRVLGEGLKLLHS